MLPVAPELPKKSVFGNNQPDVNTSMHSGNSSLNGSGSGSGSSGEKKSVFNTAYSFTAEVAKANLA